MYEKQIGGISQELLEAEKGEPREGGV